MPKWLSLVLALLAVTLGIVVVALGTGTFHASYVILGLVFYVAVIVGFFTSTRITKRLLDRRGGGG
jgi:hypothetical protein